MLHSHDFRPTRKAQPVRQAITGSVDFLSGPSAVESPVRPHYRQDYSGRTVVADHALLTVQGGLFRGVFVTSRQFY